MTTRSSTIVIAVWQQLSAFMILAGDVGFTGLAPCIQRVDVLFQLLFRTLVGVDGTAHPSHHCTPKKRGPDHRAPVMCRAMADKDRQFLPSMM